MMGGAYCFLVPNGSLEDWARLPEARLRVLRRRRSIVAAAAAAAATAATAAILVAVLASLGAVAMGVALIVTAVALLQLAGLLSIVVGCHRQLRVIEYERTFAEDRPRRWPT